MASTSSKTVAQVEAPVITEPQVSVRFAMNCVEEWLKEAEARAPAPQQLHFGIFLQRELPKLAFQLLNAETEVRRAD